PRYQLTGIPSIRDSGLDRANRQTLIPRPKGQPIELNIVLPHYALIGIRIDALWRINEAKPDRMAATIYTGRDRLTGHLKNRKVGAAPKEYDPMAVQRRRGVLPRARFRQNGPGSPAHKDGVSKGR